MPIPSAERPTPFAHLQAANAVFYREVLSTFVRAKQRFTVHLRPEDVAADLGRAVDPAAVNAALESLSGWGNLRQDPDTGRVTTVEDFKTIDSFDNGVATSIKSHDLLSKSFGYNDGLKGALTKEIDDLAGYSGSELSGVVVRGSDIVRRDLIVGINSATVSGPQYTAMVESFRYAATRGVNLSFVVIR